MSKKLLVVVDYQNDFVDGALGFEKATKIAPYIISLVKKYEEEGKMQMIIGIGCTGGQHRSVTLTNYFADHYSKFYQVYKWHRDADH